MGGAWPSRPLGTIGVWALRGKRTDGAGGDAGVCKYASGDVYEGEYKDGKFNGRGGLSLTQKTCLFTNGNKANVCGRVGRVGEGSRRFVRY